MLVVIFGLVIQVIELESVVLDDFWVHILGRNQFCTTVRKFFSLIEKRLRFEWIDDGCSICFFFLSLYFLRSIILATFHFLCNPMCNFDYLYLKLCLTKNYKNLILWKYLIRRFKQDLTWVYFSLHISRNIK